MTYWVIAPEHGTDGVVEALRRSWLSSIPPADLHFCVANNTASSDRTLHRLPVVRAERTPLDRSAFFVNGQLADGVLDLVCDEAQAPLL